MRPVQLSWMLGVSVLVACGPSYNPAREAIDAAKAAASPAPVLAEARWTCPMHPEVQLEHPGICPTCSMPLVKAGP